MQNVTFVDPSNAPMVTAAMDVPRVGEVVVLEARGFTVTAVRYYVYPQNNVRVAVVLAPILRALEAIENEYKTFATDGQENS